MGVLQNGKWIAETQYADKEGKFVRQTTSFRDSITDTGKYKAEDNRYHLYVSYACPWATRIIIMRHLKGLEDVISMSVVSPHMGNNGWEFGNFPDATEDHLYNKKYLWEIYTKAKPDCSGRVTVPVLWDKQEEKIVNNESKEIMKILDTKFQDLALNKTSYYPEKLQSDIDKTIEEIYEPINNGVYKSGFATTQEQYEKAVRELFKQLDTWEIILSKQRYLCGDIITEADISMFTTLYRFDPVYYVHFKCNLKRIVDYPNLWNYVKDLYQTPGFRESCNLTYLYHGFHHNLFLDLPE